MKDVNGDQDKNQQSDDGVVGGEDDSFFDPESYYNLNYFYNLDHDNQNRLEDQQKHDID